MTGQNCDFRAVLHSSDVFFFKHGVSEQIFFILHQLVIVWLTATKVKVFRSSANVFTVFRFECAMKTAMEKLDCVPWYLPQKNGTKPCRC